MPLIRKRDHIFTKVLKNIWDQLYMYMYMHFAKQVRYWLYWFSSQT